MKKNIFCALVLFCCAAGAFVFNSCASVQQEKIIYSDKDVSSFVAFEERFAFMDAKRFVKGPEGELTEEEIKSFLADIEKQIHEMGMNNAVLSRLYALEGRTWLLLGKKNKAQDCHKNSTKAFKGDAQAVILAYQLGLVKALDDENIVSGCNDKNLLILQQGIEAYKIKQFGSSVAYFDRAFLELEDFYRAAYSPLRDQAWKLKDQKAVTENKKVLDLLSKPELSVMELLILTNSVSDLLVPYTEGKNIKDNDLYLLVAQQNLLMPLSAQGNENAVNLKKEEVVTRIKCARFLWNLYVSKHPEVDGTMYSKMYLSLGLGSPIEDLDVHSVDFDAVLGCVENEIINLTDGVHFEGEAAAAGGDVAEWVTGW